MTDSTATADVVEPVEAAAAATADTTTTPETTPDTTATGAEAAAATDTTTEEKVVTPTWPDNWKELAADGDEDTAKIIKRYGSPRDMARALKEAQTLIRSGKLKRDMPDASDEKAVAEWRKEQGIPDKPDGYKLPDPVVKRLTDEDKPVLASFLEFAHSKNAPAAAVEIASEWYVSQMEAAAEQRAMADQQATQTAEDMLRKDWGPEYRGNLTLAKRALEGIPGVGNQWAEYRGPDGKRLGDNPEFIQWAADMGRQQFGDATFASPDTAMRHNTRKSEIEAVMARSMREYYDKKLDVEYGEILAAEAKRTR
jgi:hypothetical protein